MADPGSQLDDPGFNVHDLPTQTHISPYMLYPPGESMHSDTWKGFADSPTSGHVPRPQALEQSSHSLAPRTTATQIISVQQTVGLALPMAGVYLPAFSW